MTIAHSLTKQFSSYSKPETVTILDLIVSGYINSLETLVRVKIHSCRREGPWYYIKREHYPAGMGEYVEIVLDAKGQANCPDCKKGVIARLNSDQRLFWECNNPDCRSSFVPKYPSRFCSV